MDLPIQEVEIAALPISREGQKTAFPSQLQRLKQVDDVHLGQRAAEHSIGGRGLLVPLLQGYLVHDALDALAGFLNKERLFDEVLYQVAGHSSQLFREIG